MKRWLFALGLVSLIAPLWADIAVTPGSGKTVATNTDNSREFQNVIVTTTQYVGPAGYPQSPRVDASSNTAVYLIQPNVLGATVTFNSAQPISVLYQPTVVGATTTYNGQQAVMVSTLQLVGVDGAQTSLGYSRQGSSLPVNVLNTLTVNTHAVTGSGNFNVNVTNPSTATVYQAGVWGATTTYNGQQAVLVSTLQVIAVDGTQGSVGYSRQGSSLPVNVLNTVPVTGTFFQTTQPISGSVNITNPSTATVYQSGVWGATTTYNGQQAVLVSTLQVIAVDGTQGSVGYSRQGSSVPVNVLNTVPVTGTFFQTTQPISGAVRLDETNIIGATVTFNGTQTVNVATGGVTAAQGPPGTADWKVTQSTNVLSAGNNAIGSVWSTSTYVVNPTTVTILNGFTSTVYGVLATTGQVVSSTFTSTNYTVATFTVWPGTANAAMAIFEVSADSGTTWLPTYANQQDNSVIASSFSVNLATTTWATSIAGMTNFRVRAGNWAVGFASVTITPSALPAITFHQVQFATPNTTIFSSQTISFAATGDNTIIPAQSTGTLQVYRMFLTVSANTNLTFKDGSAPVALTGAMSMAPYGSLIFDLASDPWFVTSSGNAFIINQSGTAQVSGRVYYLKN